MNIKDYQILQTRAQKFFARLPNDFFHEVRLFETIIASSPDPVPYSHRQRLKYHTVYENECWGKLWDSAWFFIHGEIPGEWGRRDVAFKLNLGGEALIFDAEGCPLYGLTNTSVFAGQYRKELFQLSDNCAPGRIEYWLEVAANGLIGDEKNPDAPVQKCDIGIIRHLKYGLLNREVWQLALDVETVLGLLNIPRPGSGDCVYGVPAFIPGSCRDVQILTILNRAIDAYQDNPDRASEARQVLAPILQARALNNAMKVTAVGHAHIDTGWLWPVRETIRKCARTFSSQLYLMERYPDYVFGASQPQHYAFVKEHYPEIYQKIKTQVKAGRWELQGGMWVECDCNLTNGESLIRQFIHGKNFFMDEFGIEVNNLWLPDVFGYSAALPQIMHKSGCDYFLTQKISWNQHNKFPHHAFRWYGLDQTQVLCFFPPEDNYNAMLVPDQLNYGSDNFIENTQLNEYLSLFGIGNGGGGPKEEYLERGLRCHNLEGSPRVRFGRADHFFERLSLHADELPEWHGELYLEMHRGTLTTQAMVKRQNRRCEQKLVETEFLLTLCPLDSYPVEKMDAAWKKLLLNQFHDILPGSSIKEVYECTQDEHQQILALCDTLIAETAGKMFTANPDAVTYVNTLSAPFDDLLELPKDWIGVTGYPCQKIDKRIYTKAAIPPQGFLTLYRTGKPIESNPMLPPNDLILENEFIRYEFASNGELTGAYDKELGKEILSNPGNRFTLYVDIPNSYDAWDVDVSYENEAIENAVSVSAGYATWGSLRQTLAFRCTIGVSKINQKVSLESNSKQLTFTSEIEWQENKRMLRVAFPTQIQGDEASFDIQYGFIKRATHRNTSWDAARFEVVGQRYVDLSDTDYGVALLNDCKYGCKVHKGTLDLNLLRSPSWPDGTADRGHHIFTYAFLPHIGNLVEAEVMNRAAMLNRPPLRILGYDAAGIKFPCRLLMTKGVTLEVLKRAEKSNALIVRLTECHGKHGYCRLQLAAVIETAVECDLLEWHDSIPLPIQNEIIELMLTPFEIKTLKLTWRRS